MTDLRRLAEAAQDGVESDGTNFGWGPPSMDARARFRAAATPKVVVELLDTIDTQRAALQVARTEIDRHGYGDFHYGNLPRDPAVLGALADIDRVLSKP